MTEKRIEKRFIRNIVGQVYDMKNDKFLEEDYAGKPIGYEDEVVSLLNSQHEEKENYKRLFNEMAYYFRDDIKSLNDLDHKDFEALQGLAGGEYFDDELFCWVKIKLEDLE